MVTKARPSNTGPNLAFDLRHWTLPYRPQSGCQPRENGQSHRSAALPLCPNPTMSPAPLPCARIAALHPHDHQPQTANQGSSNHQSRQKPLQSCIIKAHQGKPQNMNTPHAPAIPTRPAPPPPAFDVGCSRLDVGCFPLPPAFAWPSPRLVTGGAFRLRAASG